MGALYNHAKIELEKLGEDPATVRGLLRVVSAFAKMGHSGGSASVAIPMINDLLQYKNLSPITDDPDEWYYHGPEMAPPHGLFQCKRNPALFSKDGGKTYYDVEDTNGGQDLEGKMHESVVSGKREDPATLEFENPKVSTTGVSEGVEWDIDLNQPMADTIRQEQAEKITGMALDGSSDEALDEAIEESKDALRPQVIEGARIVSVGVGVEGGPEHGVHPIESVEPVNDSGEVSQSGHEETDAERLERELSQVEGI